MEKVEAAKEQTRRIESAFFSLAFTAPEDSEVRHLHQTNIAKALNEIAQLAGLAPISFGAKEL